MKRFTFVFEKSAKLWRGQLQAASARLLNSAPRERQLMAYPSAFAMVSQVE